MKHPIPFLMRESRGWPSHLRDPIPVLDITGEGIKLVESVHWSIAKVPVLEEGPKWGAMKPKGPKEEQHTPPKNVLRPRSGEGAKPEN